MGLINTDNDKNHERNNPTGVFYTPDSDLQGITPQPSGRGPEVTISGDTVTVSKKHYLELQRAQQKLEALEAAGVDNWEWYGDAMAALSSEED